MAGDKLTEGIYADFCCSPLGGSHLTMPFQLTYSHTHIYDTLQTRQVYFLNKTFIYIYL